MKPVGTRNFGDLFAESTNTELQPYLYTGKELDRRYGLDWHDYGARHYDAARIQWTTMDPLSEKYYHLSPYAYCGNNFVNAVDPNGLSTKVIQLNDSCYQVIGGDIKDGDKGIYLYKNRDSKDPICKIGETPTMTSFYDSDEGIWDGVINVKDKSGEKFLNEIFENTPALFKYIYHARGGYRYDFKVTNGENKGNESADRDHNYKYRGMPIVLDGQIYYASARDIGNIAAGYVAAANDILYPFARVAFDIYQSIQLGKLAGEGISTTNPERLGWEYYIQQKFKNFNFIIL